MSGIIGRARNALAAAGVAGALAFGAAQVTASPAAGAEAACDVETCRTICKAIHGPFAGGWCDETGRCRCAV